MNIHTHQEVLSMYVPELELTKKEVWELEIQILQQSNYLIISLLS